MRAPKQLDGHSFPDHVLSLTWDDGPDRHTVELARYLHERHVSGTFFVVQSWKEGVSAYPGVGAHKFESGYAHIPVLDQLVHLGQRVGNHTLNHVVLPDAAPKLALRELFENQLEIDPFLTDETQLFRVPCGSWSASVAQLTRSDPYLSRMIGPVRWDIDGKDWEGSIKCSSVDPGRDCEHFQNGWRLKPTVMAKRYLNAIEHAGRGIVLLHDRVADAGASYALELARHLLPALIERRYVFAAPVLAFSPLIQRTSASAKAALLRLPPTGHWLVDADGDGKTDLCLRSASEIYCAHASESSDSPMGGIPKASLGVPEILGPAHWLHAALASRDEMFQGAALLGDIDANGTVDGCWDEARGVMCRRSSRGGSSKEQLWLGRGAVDLGPLETLAIGLADVDGDHRADFCAGGPAGVECALSTGAAFTKPRLWFADAAATPLWGDLNGDGRDDLCFRAPSGIRCAFSTGQSFTPATTWLASPKWSDDAWLGLGDINGDGRSDLCAVTQDDVLCGLAP